MASAPRTRTAHKTSVIDTKGRKLLGRRMKPWQIGVVRKYSNDYRARFVLNFVCGCHPWVNPTRIIGQLTLMP